jgi:hypothetical protein
MEDGAIVVGVAMCDGAYYVDNWIYGYQVYCTNPNEYWLNPLGKVLIVVVLIGCLFYLFRRVGKWRRRSDLG